jgi:hypothetical protein
MARHTAASGGRGVGGELGGGTWWSRCGCGGSKCIGAKSEEKKSKDSQHSRKRTETKTNKQKGKAVSTEDLPFWQNRQKLAIKKVEKKR